MNAAQNRQTNAECTPYYHVVARCVRPAALCGVDADSGQDFEYRHQWVIDRLAQLLNVFAIELCSISVFHKQYDLIIRLAPNQARSWTRDEVLERWQRLCETPDSSPASRAPDTVQSGSDRSTETIEVKRQRLSDLSWFMKSLNEHIARRARQEDSFEGDFWEDRNRVSVHFRPFLSKSL